MRLEKVQVVIPNGQAAMKQSLAELIPDVVEAIKAATPVSSEYHEHLRDTIKGELVSSGLAEISAGEGLPDARAIYVELGTADTPAQPYMLEGLTGSDIAVKMSTILSGLLQRGGA